MFCFCFFRLTCGIIARSAGLFQNSKKFCACDGKILWEDKPLSIPTSPPSQLWRHFCFFATSVDKAKQGFNPFTARVFDGVFWGDSTVWVCGQNPMIWSHSNEISLTVLTLGAIWFSKFEKMKLEHLVEICFWLNWQWKGYIKVCFSRLAVLYWIVCLFVCFFLSYLVIKKRKEVNYVQFWLW